MLSGPPLDARAVFPLFDASLLTPESRFDGSFSFRLEENNRDDGSSFPAYSPRSGEQLNLGRVVDRTSTVSIGPRIVTSGGFDALYREGMALIEEVAAYLDGAGRVDSRSLPRAAGLVFSAESMRLTTRLMQLASWLLLQRAVNEGELTATTARDEKEKVQFTDPVIVRGGPGFDELPTALVDFIAKGDRLFERVVQLDRLERGSLPENVPGARDSITDQFARLKAAFGRMD